MIDTRRMEVAVLDPKRSRMIELLGEWTTRANFNLRDISSLHGSLEILMRNIKWARPLFFALQNAICLELMRRYHGLQRWYSLEPALLPRGSTNPCATAPAGRAHCS
jgi:hypothetical protein